MTGNHQQICEIGNRLWLQGMMPAGDGNISVRLDNEQYLVTGSGYSKGFLQAHQVLYVDRDGKVLGGDGKISTEFGLHMKVYTLRDDVNAVIHAHPPYASAFCITGQQLPCDALSETIVKIGKEIPVAPYALPSSKQTAQSAEPYIKEYNAFMLMNHGAVTIGRTLNEAFMRMELIEHIAKVTYITKALGKIEKIPSEAVFALEAMAKEW